MRRRWWCWGTSTTVPRRDHADPLRPARVGDRHRRVRSARPGRPAAAVESGRPDPRGAAVLPRVPGPPGADRSHPGQPRPGRLGRRWRCDHRRGRTDPIDHRQPGRPPRRARIRPPPGARRHHPVVGRAAPRSAEVGGDGVGRVPVQAVPGVVVAAGGAGIAVAGVVLHVAQRHPGVQRQGDRRCGAASAARADPTPRSRPRAASRRTSSHSWLGRIRPPVAVASSGPPSPRHSPSPALAARSAQVGVQGGAVWRGERDLRPPGALASTRSTRCPRSAPRSAMSAAKASSTRSALCSSSRITAAVRSAWPAGVGVGGGDQRPALLPGQPDRGRVVRVHPRPRHPRRRIRRRPGRGPGSTGRTTRSPTTGAARWRPRRRRAAGPAPTGPRAPGRRRAARYRARPATPATRADPRHTSAGCAPSAGSPTTPRPAAGPDPPARRGRGARPATCVDELAGHRHRVRPLGCDDEGVRGGWEREVGHEPGR